MGDTIITDCAANGPLGVNFGILFEQAADGILLVDAKTRRFHLANLKIQQMLGYSAEELLR